MESAQDRQRGRPVADDGRLMAAGAYGVLFLLGIGQGLIGSFQYSRVAGPVPIAALAFDLLILLTCVAGAWGMRRPLGGLMPAVGWFVASFVMAMSTPGGSVVITNTGPGKWYLFGGTACALAGLIAGFVTAPRKRSR
ncbi:MAG TPA: hypothetical protein VMF87_31325 [Streptosporangiaceae bacterium]|nr:hypothetical protein [Streptosporangiaceae bacterium]